MGYRIGYNGPQVDLLLQKAYQNSVVNNGWAKLESSDSNPADLDTVMTPGNYSISFWKNGPTQLVSNGPINVCVTKDSSNNKIYQTIYDAGKIYIRESTSSNTLINTWKEVKNNTTLDVGVSAPVNPEDNFVWIDTTGDTPVVRIYKKSTDKWEAVQPKDLAKASVYDPQGIAQNITSYLDEKIADADLATAQKKYEEHINGTESIVNIIEGSLPIKTAQSIYYINDKFIILYRSKTDNYLYSTDGINWTQRNLPSEQYWMCICYGNNIYIAVARNTDICAYSTDGIHWDEVPMPNNEVNWSSVCYGNDKFVAVSSGTDAYAYSTDGIAWTKGTMPSEAQWYSVCYGNGNFIAIAGYSEIYNSNICAYSTDGIHWDEVPMPNNEVNWSSVCYGNDKFVAVSLSNTYAYSTDGIHWTQGTFPSNHEWCSICYGNGKFVSVNSSYTFAYSTDGIHWTQGTFPSNHEWSSIAYNNDKFVVISDNSFNSAIINITDPAPIHVTTDEKNKWAAGISESDAQTQIDTLHQEITEYANTQISTATNSVNSIKSDVTTLDTQITTHENDDTIHLTQDMIDAFDNKAEGNHTHINDGTVKVSAAKLTGTLDIARLDLSVLERNYTVNNYDEMMALTKVEIQNGDSVYIKGKNETTVEVSDGTMPSSKDWQSVCYGNDKFVAVAYNSNVFAYSTDGINWTQGTMPSSKNWQSVCYGNGKFVAVVYNSNVFAYSTDGINWTQGTMPSSQSWWSVCYGNGKFVAIAYNSSNIFAYSTDGIKWTSGTMPSSKNWQSVCYGNGKFVAISNSSNVFAYSSDGINWTQGTMPSSQSWRSVCYGNGKFVAVVYSSNIVAYSTDGINWTQGTMPSSQSWCSICYGKDKFVAVADSTKIFAYSTDGINWTQGSLPSTQRWCSICYGKDKFVTIAKYRNVFASITFTDINEPSSAWFVTDDSKLGEEVPNITNIPIRSSGYSVCYGNDKFVATGYSTFVYSTDDGITWTKGNMPSIQQWGPICYGKDKFVAIAERLYGNPSNVFAYSTDGINWTQGNMPGNNFWWSLCYDGGKFVTISSTTFAYSTDGINWTQGTMPSNTSWRSVCYGNGKFVAVGINSNIVAYSTDGINWTQGTMPSSQSWCSICYGKDKFVAVADSTKIFAYSTDGINWTSGSLPSTQRWCSICYGKDKFVTISGYIADSNIFAYSTDGITWTQGTMPSTQRWYSVCYGNDKFVATSEFFINDNTFATISDFMPAGLVRYAAPDPELTWDNIHNRPASLADLGLSDSYYTKEEIDQKFQEIIDSLNTIQERVDNFNNQMTNTTIPSDLLTTYQNNLNRAIELNKKLDNLLLSLGISEEKANYLINMYKNRSIKYKSDGAASKTVTVNYKYDTQGQAAALSQEVLDNKPATATYSMDYTDPYETATHVIDDEHYPAGYQTISPDGGTYEFKGWVVDTSNTDSTNS